MTDSNVEAAIAAHREIFDKFQSNLKTLAGKLEQQAAQKQVLANDLLNNFADEESECGLMVSHGALTSHAEGLLAAAAEVRGLIAFMDADVAGHYDELRREIGLNKLKGESRRH